jgi:hypothetical protein
VTDLLITYLLATVAALAIAYVMVAPPGAGQRLVSGLTYHRAGGRHAQAATSAALAAIPDALTIARTA